MDTYLQDRHRIPLQLHNSGASYERCLQIVLGSAIRLGYQSLIDAYLFNFDFHIKRFLLCSEISIGRSIPVGTNTLFPDVFHRNRNRSHAESLLYQHLGTLFRSLSLSMKLAV